MEPYCHCTYDVEHPNIRIQLSNADPELYFIVNSGDVTGIRTLLMRRIMSGHKVIFEKKLKEQSVWANPDDPENQAYIQEQVRLQNVQVNMETAMEELPEGFGRVCMLYVDVEINGKWIVCSCSQKAFAPTLNKDIYKNSRKVIL